MLIGKACILTENLHSMSNLITLGVWESFNQTETLTDLRNIITLVIEGKIVEFEQAIVRLQTK